MSSTPSTQEKVADIMTWIGSDAFWYLSIREVFLQAERENHKEILDTLDAFHRICKITIETRG